MSIPFPEINASLNGAAFVFLNFGFYFIRKKKVHLHRKCMITAFLCSVVFLVSYLIYHYTKQAINPFGGEGIWRVIYYFILITHIILAMVIVPLILRTFYLAIKGRFQEHRKIAKWTFPLWYYVSITGVLVYLFLYQWFVI